MTRRTFPLFALLLALVMGSQPSPVRAHNELLTAVPAPGATLTTTPTEIRLTFSEPLARGSILQLFGQNFQPIFGISATIDRDSPEDLVAAAPSLPPGDYTVQWTSIAHDGDTLSGSYSFTLLAQAQSDDRLLIWSVAAAGGLALAAGLAWLYRRRGTPAGKKIGEVTE